MVLADRTPPGSQRSTWVERGHARRLGRRESASAYWFCTSCGRALYAIKKASGFPHGSSVDSCGNRSVFGWLCRTRLGEVQNRPSATSPIPKVLQCGSAQLEMASPYIWRRNASTVYEFIRRGTGKRSVRPTVGSGWDLAGTMVIGCHAWVKKCTRGLFQKRLRSLARLYGTAFSSHRMRNTDQIRVGWHTMSQPELW